MIDNIELEDHRDARGRLYVGTVGKEIPFEIKRFYVITDVPRGESRGMHAHRKTERVAFCLRGSFDLLADDGKHRETVPVEASRGVRLRTMVWHTLSNFSEGALVLVVASEPYDEADYMRNYEDFLNNLK